jgi:exodeoxyribonuclease V beta subunit
MLSRLDSALQSANGEALATAIRTRFPVAMIDEFQDTDPQQYRIFRRIWHHQPESGLLILAIRNRLFTLSRRRYFYLHESAR